MFGRDANLIVSVRSPVGTGVPKTGQRITISDITFGPSGVSPSQAQAKDGKSPSRCRPGQVSRAE
jgi:hypothetical protein